MMPQIKDTAKDHAGAGPPAKSSSSVLQAGVKDEETGGKDAELFLHSSITGRPRTAALVLGSDQNLRAPLSFLDRWRGSSAPVGAGGATTVDGDVLEVEDEENGVEKTSGFVEMQERVQQKVTLGVRTRARLQQRLSAMETRLEQVSCGVLV